MFHRHHACREECDTAPESYMALTPHLPPVLSGWLKRVGDGISLTRSPTAAITCPHGGLMPQAPGLSGSRRIAVTPRVWHFVKHFWETEVATDEGRKRAASAAKAAGVAKTKASAVTATATDTAAAAATTKEAPMELGDDEDDNEDGGVTMMDDGDDVTITADIVPPPRPHPPAQPWLINGIPPKGAVSGLPRFRAPPAKAEGGKAARGESAAGRIEVKKTRGAGLPRTRPPPPEAEEEEVALVEHPAVEVEEPGGAPAAAGPSEVMGGAGSLHCQEFPASCSVECTRWGFLSIVLPHTRSSRCRQARHEPPPPSTCGVVRAVLRPPLSSCQSVGMSLPLLATLASSLPWQVL